MADLAISEMPDFAAPAVGDLVETSRLSATIRVSSTLLFTDQTDNSITINAGTFQSYGFAVGDRINVVGFTNPANNLFSAEIETLSNNKITIAAPEGGLIVTEAAGPLVTISKWATGRLPVSTLGAGGGNTSGMAGATGVPSTGVLQINSTVPTFAGLVGGKFVIDRRQTGFSTATFQGFTPSGQDFDVYLKTRSHVSMRAASAFFGICVQDGAPVQNPKSVTFGFFSNDEYTYRQYWNNTTFVSEALTSQGLLDIHIGSVHEIWWRVARVGTTLNVYASIDGYYYVLLRAMPLDGSNHITDVLTVGIAMNYPALFGNVHQVHMLEHISSTPPQ